MIGTVAENVLVHGTGALNIDGCRVGVDGGTKRSHQAAHPRNPDGSEDRSQHWARTGHGAVPIDLGRWPANVIHDGSDEVEAAFAVYGDRKSGKETSPRGSGGIWSPSSGVPAGPQYGDTGSASRFFYSAKASKQDRAGSKHPTVKPVALMRYLCRLVTPKGGCILDPFGGSGTTGEAAAMEGFRATLIEREAEYVADIERRLGRVEPPIGGLF